MDIFDISSKIVLSWMSQYLTHDYSTLFYVASSGNEPMSKPMLTQIYANMHQTID